MMNMSFHKRSFILIVLFLVAIYITRFITGELHEVPIGKSLDSLPVTIGAWSQARQFTLDEEIVDMLGVDNYIEKVYTSPDEASIDLYVSYFKVLKEGKQFHSPKNCLIGSGSTLIKNEVMDIPLPGGHSSVPVGYMELQKGERKQLILYWYQCRGRIMYSEYEERIYRVIDAITKKRTDGAFVRIIATDDDGDIRDTQEKLVAFTSQIIPILKQIIPGDR